MGRHCCHYLHAIILPLVYNRWAAVGSHCQTYPCASCYDFHYNFQGRCRWCDFGEFGPRRLEGLGVKRWGVRCLGFPSSPMNDKGTLLPAIGLYKRGPKRVLLKKLDFDCCSQEVGSWGSENFCDCTFRRESSQAGACCSLVPLRVL